MRPSPVVTGTKAAQPSRDLPGEVGLTDPEAGRVRDLLGREPNDLEWAMFGAMWSEHCAYKHSKRLLRTLPTTGQRVAIGPGENAGAVDIGGGLLCVFKIESHNHPSAVEPFQGAATGVGGILRDIFAMGARPVALLNALAFGDPAQESTRRAVRGVVGGISFYGNCVGIPDVGGHVSFGPGYGENPLVNAMCVGLVPTDQLASASTARPGSAVYLVGSDTGRDGIAGASLLASFELGPGGDAKRPSVQVGNPFLEKLLLEACLELIGAGAVEAIQDLGAAGLCCAASEVAAKSRAGIRVDVAAVPRRASGMEPFEVMLSESQERMLVVARPGREAETERVFARWELHAARIGEITLEETLEIRDRDTVVASLPPAALADDAPEHDIDALADSYRAESAQRVAGEVYHAKLQADADMDQEVLRLLASPDVASRRALYRTYDQMVGTDTVLGPGADAAVLRIKGRTDGIAVTVDAQPRLASQDPYAAAVAAVAEATRNLVCVGAEPLAITDCLNLGNPEGARGAWELRETVAGIAAACRALGVPVVSGNVSLYNATSGRDIWPTAVIGAVGHLADVARHLGASAVRSGDRALLAGSLPVDAWLDEMDLALEVRLHRFVLAAHAAGLVRAAHDRAEGGLVGALAEMCIRAGIGAVATLPAVRGASTPTALFAEAPSGIVLAAEPAHEDALRRLAAEDGVPLRTLGAFGGDVFTLGPVALSLGAIERAHSGGLERALGRIP